MWSIRHLRRVEFKKDELVSVYTVMIRPVAEYYSVVFYTLIPEVESQILDIWKIGGIGDHFNTLGLSWSSGSLGRVGPDIIVVAALTRLSQTFRVTSKEAFKNCGK